MRGKAPRTQIPAGRSLLSNFMRLYASAAYRPGQARYCQYINEVHFGQWVGGIVGLKSILGLSSREQAFLVLKNYQIGACSNTSTTQNPNGFPTIYRKHSASLFPPKGIPHLRKRTRIPVRTPVPFTQPLIQAGYVFEEIDAWLDLWIHTIYRDSDSPSQIIVPLVQFDTGPALTLASLGNRWGWERTKVWRFSKSMPTPFFLSSCPVPMGLSSAT